VISDFVNLKKRGSNYVGLCPFHNEKTPSFSVSASKGIYKCFGCGKGGDVVNFIMEHEHYNYVEALRYLAKKFNIEIREEEETAEYILEHNEKESLYNISQFAQKYFSDCLHNHNEGKAVGLSYFIEREFNDESIEKFQLGYCLDSWNEFTTNALKNGYSIDYLIKSGLTVERQGGDHYDRFRGRVIFPIHNLSGKVIAFAGRILKKDPNKPKYINSPENDIYNKSKVLYGLFFAKNTIVKENNCYLVEGYTDVISLFQNGIQNVVASSGTSLTVDQIRLIKRFTNHITILFDGDEAGLKASFRGIDLILEQGMNVNVVLLPADEDPDSFARKYRTSEIKDFIDENSRDFIRFKTGLLIEEVKNDPVKKTALIREVVSSISLIPDDINRREYIKACAQLMDVDEQALIYELNRELRKRFKKRTDEIVRNDDPVQEEHTAVQQIEYKTDDSEYHESEIVRLILNYGNEKLVFENENEFGHIETSFISVAGFIINDLHHDEIVFETPVYRRIYEEIVQNYEDDVLKIGSQYFTSHSDPQISKVAIELLSKQHELSENWLKNKIYVNSEEDILKEVVISSVLALKAKKISKDLNLILKKIKNSNDVEEQLKYLKEHSDLKEILMKINKILGRIISQ